MDGSDSWLYSGACRPAMAAVDDSWLYGGRDDAWLAAREAEDPGADPADLIDPGRLSRPDIEAFQDDGWAALCGPATHVMLAGGARSGKTFLICRWLVLRATRAPEATQAILRLRFNHLKASIIYDTLPRVVKTVYRDYPAAQYVLNKSDWYAEFPNGHRIYFGGLDDKERTEKILGQGHSTLYLNECSQLSYSSRNKAVTRLSQDLGLDLKEVCDENPPMQGHWTHRLWVKGVDPVTGKALSPEERADYAAVYMNPADNPHIPEHTKRILQALPPREKKRFWYGQFGDAVDGPLWTYESIEGARVAGVPAALVRVVIAIDPSGCRGPEDKRSDEVGIVVAGLGDDGSVYVLEDASGRIGPGGPDGWGVLVTKLFAKWKADLVVAESNFGGAMVQAVISAANPDLPFKELHATRGKVVRADAVATLTDNGRVKLVGVGFPELEQQLLQFSTAGYGGDKSPDRADAMVWAVTELAVDRVAGQGLLDWYMQQAAKKAESSMVGHNGGPALDDGATTVALRPAPGQCGQLTVRSGRAYNVDGASTFRARPEDVDDLTAMGCRRIDPLE